MNDAEGCLWLFLSVFPAIFKNHPDLGYKISVFIPVLILGAMFLFDPDPSDRVFAIFGIGFIFSVFWCQIFRAIRRQGVQDIQAIDEEALAQ